MKLLIVSPIFPPEIGGPATYCNELLKRLPAKIDVRVISFGKEKVENPRVTIVPTVGNLLQRQLRLFKTVLASARHCHIIYIQEPAVVGLATVLAGTIYRKKIVTKYVGDPSWEYYQSKGGTLALDKYLSTAENHDFLWFAAKIVFRLSSAIIIPGAHLGGVLQKYYSVKSEKIKLIPNSIEPENIISKKNKNQLVFVGRLVVWKNVNLVLEALKIISKKGIKFNLKIVGSGPEENKLKQITIKYGLQNCVQFLGQMSGKAVRDILSQSEIFILVSSYEGLSHVLLEAQAQGVIPVVSDIPGNLEAINDGYSGFSVKIDSKSLAKRLESLLKNQILRKRLQNNAKKFVENKFSWETNLPMLLDIFHDT